ncbi:MAG TPA: phosphodiester glycosidase family protein [Acidimicrobiia bacterium]|nr:phosphodiester glycosidase family protein [Acidimicrobiia bacterium]
MPPAVFTFALSLLLIAALSPAAQAGVVPGPNRFDVTARADLYDGVEYLKLAKPSVPVVAHVAHIERDAPVDLRVVNAHDKIPTSTRDLETTSSMCGRVRCVVGVDGDFHYRGSPLGGVVSGGRMLRSPNPGRPQVTVTGSGDLLAGPMAWSGSLVLGDGSQIPLAGINVARVPNAVVLYTPAYGGRTPDAPGIELVLNAATPPGKLNHAAPVTLKGARNLPGGIPANGAVLAADGVAADQLVALWGRVVGSTLSPQAEVLVQSPVDAAESIGADPVVLRDGQRALPWLDPNLAIPRQPHTLVGWNKAGDVFLVAVDGRQTASEGMTMAEAADFLVGLGATDAVNLDGGGGTVMAAGGSVWNGPSDAGGAERGAVNALVVMTRPGAPHPDLKPRAPAPIDPAVRTPTQGPVSGPAHGGGTPIGPPAPLTTEGSEATPAGTAVDGGAESGSGESFGTSAASGSRSAGKGRLSPGSAGQELAAAESDGRDGDRAEESTPVTLIATPFRAVSSVVQDVAPGVVSEVVQVWKPNRLPRAGGVVLVGMAAVTAHRRRRRRRGPNAGA